MRDGNYKGETAVRRVGWLLAELVVVFIGVYAAFELNQFQEERQQELRRAQIYETLQENLEGDVQSGRQFLIRTFCEHSDRIWSSG